MATRTNDDGEPYPADAEGDAAYDAYIREKVARGLEQSRDRGAMIPIEQVWRELGVER